jgi:heme A synthase
VTRFQRLSLATAVATYVMVVIGGTVRITNSGLSCVDWPRCNGKLIPSANGHVLIEYSHRLFAMLVSVLVVACAVWAWRSFRRDRGILTLSTAAVVVLLVQIALGGATVTQKLSAPIVTMHLGTAMILLATTVLLALLSLQRTRAIVRREPEGTGSPRLFRNAAFAGAAGMYVLLLSGAYTASSGAGTACSTWPLCNGQVIPHGSRYVEIHFFHRLVVVAVTVALAILVIGAYRWLRGNPMVQRAVRDALGLFVVQIMLGALNVWTTLATPVRVLHLATGAALWAALVAIGWMGHTVSQPEREPAVPVTERTLAATVRRSQEAAG